MAVGVRVALLVLVLGLGLLVLLAILPQRRVDLVEAVLVLVLLVFLLLVLLLRGLLGRDFISLTSLRMLCFFRFGRCLACCFAVTTVSGWVVLSLRQVVIFAALVPLGCGSFGLRK